MVERFAELLGRKQRDLMVPLESFAMSSPTRWQRGVERMRGGTQLDILSCTGLSCAKRGSRRLQAPDRGRAPSAGEGLQAAKGGAGSCRSSVNLGMSPP